MGQHVTVDWLPTLMGLATNNTWTGSYSGAEIDGDNIWPHLTSPPNTISQVQHREEIVFTSVSNGSFAMQYKTMKYMTGLWFPSAVLPPVIFEQDQMPESSRKICYEPSLTVDKTWMDIHVPIHRDDHEGD